MFVYALGASPRGPVKVGFSKAPPTRLRSLQSGNPDNLLLLGILSFPNEELARLAEKIIHCYLRDYKTRLGGRDWFNVPPGVIYEILERFPIVRRTVGGKIRPELAHKDTSDLLFMFDEFDTVDLQLAVEDGLTKFQGWEAWYPHEWQRVRIALLFE